MSEPCFDESWGANSSWGEWLMFNPFDILFFVVVTGTMYTVSDHLHSGCGIHQCYQTSWLSQVRTRVLWNTYTGALLLHEIMWDSAHSWRRLQVRHWTHTFALLTMVIALCTIKHLWIWTCWTNCTVLFMSIRNSVQTCHTTSQEEMPTWTALVLLLSAGSYE